MGHWFLGTESVGVELFGSVDRERAHELARAPLAFEEDGEGRVRASVLAIAIEDLEPLRIPFLRMSYPEVVWMLHLRSESGGCRLAVRAHTNARMIPALSIMDRYNTDPATIRVDPPQALHVDAKGAELAVRVRPGEPHTPQVIDRLLTRARSGVLYEIPWGAHAPERTERLSFDVESRTLVDEVFGGSFRFDPLALAYYNRRHACSPAVALRG